MASFDRRNAQQTLCGQRRNSIYQQGSDGKIAFADSSRIGLLSIRVLDWLSFCRLIIFVNKEKISAVVFFFLESHSIYDLNIFRGVECVPYFGEKSKNQIFVDPELYILSLKFKHKIEIKMLAGRLTTPMIAGDNIIQNLCKFAKK